MRDIDAQITRTLDRTTTRIDGGSVTPNRSFTTDNSRITPGERSKTPPTNNPSAETLTYTPASEARDVSARLDQYSKQAMPPNDASTRRFDLTEALKQAQLAAPEYLSAEEDYIIASIRVLVERHLWTPIISNVTSVGLSGTGNDGRFGSAANVLNTLQVSQRLPMGGQVQAQWLWQATEQLREVSSGGSTNSSALALSGQIPLLRGAGYIAQESLIQAERDLIYRAREFENFRRNFMVEIARDYYALLEARSGLANQQRRVDLLENITIGEQARYEAGRIAEFSKNRAENDLLSARAGLALQREQYIVTLERFKVRLGLTSLSAAELVEQELDLPEPEVGLDRAVELALEYRLDLQTRRDQLDDSKRAVANAENQTLPDLNLTGQVSVPTDPRRGQGNLSFSPGDTSYSVGASLGLPLDRVAERLAVRQRTIEHQRAQREYDRFRDILAVEVRQSVRQIDLARFQLTLAERQVEINKRRVEETELKADLIETREKVDAANELQDSENARDRARTALRNAVLNYLRLSGQLRISREGTFERLPGMKP